MKLTEQQKQEIADQKAQKFETRRVTSPELEKILYDAIPYIGSWICSGCRLYGR